MKHPRQGPAANSAQNNALSIEIQMKWDPKQPYGLSREHVFQVDQIWVLRYIFKIPSQQSVFCMKCVFLGWKKFPDFHWKVRFPKIALKQ